MTRRPVLAPSVPWRTIGALALIAILVAAAFAVYVGSQPRLPAPFGPTRNGLIAYDADGDIFTADPMTGATTAVVTGPEFDVKPVFSRDGTSVAFERKVGGQATGPGRLLVARFDGRDPVVVTPEPVTGLTDYTFSPNGRKILFMLGPETSSTMWIAEADGSGVTPLEVGMNVTHRPSFRPPDGAEVVFASFASDETVTAGNGVYAVDVGSGRVRTIVEPSAGVGIGWVRVAPDGSRIAFTAWTPDTSRNTHRVHVRRADGTGDVTLPMPAEATFQDGPEWSNAGTRLAVARGFATFNQDMVLAAVPADGAGVGVETEHGLTGCCGTVSEWSPDDTSILTTPINGSGFPVPQLLWDPLTGTSRPAPWAATSEPAWQRLAP